jgi:hypothetical protein
MLDRLLETDTAPAPGQFVRNARHEFVFPPQYDAALEDDTSIVIDPSPETELVCEVKWWKYGQGAAESRISAHYDDAANRVDISVSDEIGTFSFPNETIYEIGEVFRQEAPRQAT